MKNIFNKIGKLPKDKILHFSSCALIAALVGNVLTHFTGTPQEGILWGGVTAAFIGFIKEMIDQFTTSDFSHSDLATDVLGAAVGTGITIIPFI